MPIRIQGPQAPAVPPTPDAPPEAMPQGPPDALPDQQDAVSQPALQKFSADKVEPAVARYMTSDQGPFICSNCEHFTPEGDCHVVSGPIDPNGVCILFTPGGSGANEAEPEPDQSDYEDTDVPESEQ